MYLTYIRRELRRRFKQSLVIALGLAVGIALVVTVSSAAAGVKSAQGQVLHSLYGVGTDMTVTKSLGRGAIGPQRFRGFGSGPPQGGTCHISREVLRPQIVTGTIAAANVAKVGRVDGVPVQLVLYLRRSVALRLVESSSHGLELRRRVTDPVDELADDP